MNNHSNSFSEDETPLEEDELWYLLSLYVDGEADPKQAAIVEQMLNSDPAYRRDFDFLMQSANVLHSVEEVAPPEGLQEAIYAGTSRRPTLVGRLRAAWGGITLPTMGRYAGIGGAFAAAALAVLFLWPHKTHLPSGSGNPPSVADVAVERPSHNEVAPPVQTQPLLNNIVVPTFPVTPSVHPEPPREPRQVHNDRKPEIKPGIAPDPRKSGAKQNAGRYATGTPFKQHTPATAPTRNTASPSDSAANAHTQYAYDPHMDNDSAQNRKMTIFNAANEDIGPMVAVQQHDDTPAVQPPHQNPPAPTASNADATPDPKPRVRIAAALPPDAKQNIATSLIRRDINTKYNGYDRSVAESIQRHEVTIDVIKGTF